MTRPAPRRAAPPRAAPRRAAPRARLAAHLLHGGTGRAGERFRMRGYGGTLVSTSGYGSWVRA